MSWVEYDDMFERAQERGEYHLFVFDLKGSRSIGYFTPHISLLLYGIYFRIKDLEKRFDKKILHQNPIFNKGDRGDLMEPFFISGDLFGFTIIRGSLCEEDVYKIFNEMKSELDLNYEFHYDNGFYETDNYIERNTKYFRGYCMQYLEDRAKTEKYTCYFCEDQFTEADLVGMNDMDKVYYNEPDMFICPGCLDKFFKEFMILKRR